MQVSNIELSKKLFELSGWDGTHIFYDADNDLVERRSALMMHPTKNCPAYDAGYLLRKLPEYIELKKNLQDTSRTDVKGDHRSFGWLASYRHEVNDFHSSGIPNITRYFNRADTPENALCKLAIQLFEQGILTNLN